MLRGFLGGLKKSLLGILGGGIFPMEVMIGVPVPGDCVGAAVV